MTPQLNTGKSLKYVFWDRLCVFSYVTVRDIISILHHDQISEVVIDSWLDTFFAMYDEARYIRSTVVFTSKCWDMIHTKKPFQILHNLVDDKLETIGQFDVLIFPLLVKDFKGATRKMGDHWTILILNLGSCEWCFYNSIKPRRGESTDSHLVGENVVVEHVETKLRKIFKGKYGCHSLLSKGSKKPESVPCLQQHPHSVECGVIVCEHIENTLLHNPKKTAFYSKSKAGNIDQRWLSGRSSVLCKCLEEARLCTSWTDANPGRRFYGCRYWRVDGRGMRFFEVVRSRDV
ncbi:hypothetical protein ACS0TY_007066 [Phlomoides rotata]